jgi:AbiV family abortive infection protein
MDSLDLIPNKELAKGIKKCFNNAAALLDDATFLKDSGRKERAYTLFQLANEEIAKTFLVFFFLTEPDKDKKIKGFRKDFQAHKVKIKQAFNLDIVLLGLVKGKKTKQKIGKILQYEHSQHDAINDLKNFSLYTSIIANKFKEPKEIITIKKLQAIESRVIFRYKVAKDFFEMPFTKSAIKNGYVPTIENINELAQEFLNDLYAGKI